MDAEISNKLSAVADGGMENSEGNSETAVDDGGMENSEGNSEMEGKVEMMETSDKKDLKQTVEMTGSNQNNPESGSNQNNPESGSNQNSPESGSTENNSVSGTTENNVESGTISDINGNKDKTSEKELLTEEMIQEEKDLHDKLEKEEKKLKEKMEEQWRLENAKLREMRFQRLQFLLQKSSMYTNYLLSRMTKQKEEEKLKEEKRRKRLQNKLEKSRQNREHPQTDSSPCKENRTPTKGLATETADGLLHPNHSPRQSRENSPEIRHSLKQNRENSPQLRRSPRHSRENSPETSSLADKSADSLKKTGVSSRRSSARNSRANTPDITNSDNDNSGVRKGERRSRGVTPQVEVLNSEKTNKSTRSSRSRPSTPVSPGNQSTRSTRSRPSTPVSPGNQSTRSTRSRPSTPVSPGNQSNRSTRSRPSTPVSPGNQSTRSSRSRTGTPQLTDVEHRGSSQSSSRSITPVPTKDEQVLSVSELSGDTDGSQGSRRSSRIGSRVATPVSTPGRNTKKSPRAAPQSQKRGRKRKVEKQDNYNIADYFEEALSRAKKSKPDRDEKSEDDPDKQGNIKVNNDVMDDQEEAGSISGKGQESKSTTMDIDSIVPSITVTEEQSTEQEIEQKEDKPKTPLKKKCRMINGEVVPDNQPIMFTGGVLRDYQMEGFKWLKILYENGINGILADEMGLGKTIQCIALISHIIYNGIQGPYLVCAPLSTVPNWVSEFKRFSPEIPVMLYHGTIQEREVLRRKINKLQRGVRKNVDCYPVVVTSYEIVMNDRKHMHNHEWKFIIVDEGHRLKNFQCKLIKELKLYRSTHRLLLTGTPLQNNLSELWSLLNFLLPEIFDDLSSFEMWFDIGNLEKSDSHNEIVQEEQKKSVITMLHQILNPFMLRRMKCDVALGVPPKREVLVYAPMSRRQKELHKAVGDRTIRQLVEKEEEEFKPDLDEKGRPKRKAKKLLDYDTLVEMMNDDGQEEISEEKFDKWLENALIPKKFEDNYIGYKEQLPKDFEVNLQLRNVMMLLRKITNHPYLIEYPLTDHGQFKVDDDLIKSSGKLMLMDKMLQELKKRNHKVLLFSQMTKVLDIVEDYCYHRKYAYCRLDGSMRVDERKEQIESFNEDPEVFIFLLSTRAGGLGLNLVAADTVIIFDSDWNPQNDLQAQDRCHRIGQKRPVIVYRLITAGTIDQKIVERAAAKRKLEKMIIHKGRFKDASVERLTAKLAPLKPDELIELLRSVDYDDVVTGKEDQVISKKDLDSLLDRSDLWATMKKRNQDSSNNNGESVKSTPEKTEVIEDLVNDTNDPLKATKGIDGVFKIVDDEKGDTVVC